MKAKRSLTRLFFSKPVNVLAKTSRTLSLRSDYQKNIKIRSMTFDEAEWTRSEWASKGEGWPSMVGGVLPNYNQDNEGFYTMELEGQRIGSISMITFNRLKMAYVGFYILREPHRGKGLGRVLMEEVINHSEKNRGITTFGLNCADAAVPLYEKFGFKTYTKDDFWSLKLPDRDDYQVKFNDQQLSDVSLFPAALLSYDETVYGDARTNYLHAVCSKPSTITVLCEEEGKITGYGVISERLPAKAEEHKSYRIGPLYADNSDVAAEILNGLIASAAQKPSTIFLETPGTNPSSAKIMSQFGFTKTFTMSKMYRGEPPKHDEEKIFGYSSVAFG